MRDDHIRRWMALVGVVLIAAGIVGFVPNPIVGPDGPVRANSLHDVVHLVTGLLALSIAFGTTGPTQAKGAIAFGMLYAILFVTGAIDPTGFGLFGDAPVNGIDDGIHAAIAVVSVAFGLLARSGAPAVAR